MYSSMGGHGAVITLQLWVCHAPNHQYRVAMYSYMGMGDGGVIMSVTISTSMYVVYDCVSASSNYLNHFFESSLVTMAITLHW